MPRSLCSPTFHGILRLLAVAACLAGAGVAFARPPSAPVVLISMDGFRWDYTKLHPAETTHIRELARRGVSAEGLVPVFPSNTFPNHYAIATGLYPSHHGIINNHMFDASLGEYFHYTQPNAARDSRWWGGEPVWITAVREGHASACSFWPGSEAAIKGLHATYWKPYNYSVPFEQRLNEVVGWLKLPPAQRPVVVTFYLEETNTAGHVYGPDSQELAETVRMLDERVGTMMGRFAAEHIPVNFVLVSDHGMTTCSPDRVVILDDYLDLKTVQVDFDETVGGLRPAPGQDVATIVRQLSAMPHMKVYRAEDLPARLHVDPKNPRVPPVWIVPEEGWQVMRRSLFARMKAKFLKGQHGYDPALPSMHGIFIASGPAFREGVTIPETANVNIYNLLCAAAGLTPAPNDGDDSLVKSALQE